MARFFSGGPMTSVEAHDRAIEQAVERALSAAIEGVPLLQAVRGGTNPEPVPSGIYNSSDEYEAWEVYGDPISTNPLGP